MGWGVTGGAGRWEGEIVLRWLFSQNGGIDEQNEGATA